MVRRKKRRYDAIPAPNATHVHSVALGRWRGARIWRQQGWGPHTDPQGDSTAAGDELSTPLATFGAFPKPTSIIRDVTM